MKKIGLCLMAMLLTVGLFAQKTSERVAGANSSVVALAKAKTYLAPAQLAEEATEKIATQLDLTAQQRQAIYAINLDAAEKIQEIQNVHGADAAMVEAKHQSLFENSTAKVLRALTPEQQRMYRMILSKTKPMTQQQKMKVEQGKRY